MVFVSRPFQAPQTGKKASEYPVGSIVYLSESGVPTEYIVVHQGIPTSFYDETCNGTWLLRKDIYSTVSLLPIDPDSVIVGYKYTNVPGYLNNEFLSLFDENTSKNILTINQRCWGVEYINGGFNLKIDQIDGVKIFILNAGSLTETIYYEDIPPYCLDYFYEAEDELRISNYNGVPDSYVTSDMMISVFGRLVFRRVDSSGALELITGGTSSGNLRPALILNPDTIFDAKSNTIK